LGATRFIDMDVAVDETGEDHEVAEIVVGRAVSDRHDHPILVANSGRPDVSLEHHSTTAQRRHGCNLPRFLRREIHRCMDRLGSEHGPVDSDAVPPGPVRSSIGRSPVVVASDADSRSVRLLIDGGRPMSDLLSRHENIIAPVIAFDTDVVAERAEGLWVTDKDGNRWADFACGTAVTNLGHNHPAVVSAAHDQLDRVIHSGCIFRYDSLVEAAQRLAEITPPGIEKFAFANSGAEAVEAAVKLARYHTKRQGVITFRGAFHGRTMGSVSYTTSNAKYRDGYHPILGS